MIVDITFSDESIEVISHTSVQNDNNNLSNLVIKSDLAEVEAKIPDISGLATKQEVQTVDSRIPDITPLATKTELNEVQNQIPDISNLATKNEVALVEAKIPDISGLATKQEVQTVDSRIPDITPLATKTELNEVQNIIPTVPENISAFNNDANYVTDKVLQQNLLVANALTTGSVSDNPIVYADVEKSYRSTFDLSKFTVVGSPVISADGVASGFSTSNYLNTGYLLDTTKPWAIYTGKGRFNDVSTLQTILCSSYKNDAGSDNNPMQIALTAQGKLRLLLSSVNNYGATTPDIANAIVGNNTFTTNTDYYFKLEFNGNKYTLSYSVDGANYITDITVNSSSTIAPGYVFIGLRLFVGRTDNPMLGSIDLKQFSITVDGKEVFNGNKTGLDVIKPDNYEVVGSPVISDDGVASGFSISNCLTIDTSTIDWTKPYKIKIKCNTGNITNVNGNLTCHNMPITRINDGYLQFSPALLFSDITSVGFIKDSVTVLNNTDYYLIATFDGTTYTFEKSLDNKNYTLIGTSTTIVTNLSTGGTSTIGTSYGISNEQIRVWNGSIDFNAFKIYVDGNLVYQPCLKIPYTLTKGGAKIANVIYRERVKDMYNQFGYAPYYTIDNENQEFSLPAGDLYGMIQKLSDRIANLES